LKVRKGSGEEIPHTQGKRNPSKTVGVARGHQTKKKKRMGNRGNKPLRFDRYDSYVKNFETDQNDYRASSWER